MLNPLFGLKSMLLIVNFYYQQLV